MNCACVVGLGYIGLPTAIMASDVGYKVIGYDIDHDKVFRINNGDPVIEEPELSTRLKKALHTKNFIATTDIACAEFFIMCVPTPFCHESHQPKSDLRYVWAAVDAIATVLKKGNVIILESTVPVGTTKELAKRLAEKTGLQEGVDFFVAHCPERVLPGNIFHELSYNARIIGGVSRASVEKAKAFYKPFVKAALYLTNAESAEMVKLIENSSRDVAIAFANQVAAMAYKAGLNPFEIIELANQHPRVNILKPSCGVGGHCIAVDPWFLVETFPQETQLLAQARAINNQKPHHIIQIIETFAKKWHEQHHRACKVLILGLTYKPDIDDLRESPALYIAQRLSKNSLCEISICEPHVKDQLIEELVGVRTSSLEQKIEEVDIILSLVKHHYFTRIDKTMLAGKTIFDFCGLFYQSSTKDVSDFQEHSFWPTIDNFIKPIIDYAQENSI